MPGSKLGNTVAKGLGISLKYRNETGDPVVDDKLTRGESVFSIDSADGYIEQEPHAGEWLRSIAPTPHRLKEYVSSLFPFTHWILSYNLQWFYGDLVAGMATPVDS